MLTHLSSLLFIQAQNRTCGRTKYKTIGTTKEVLLENAPEGLRPPVFAFPLGVTTVGTVTLEAYDYGTPVAYASPTPQLRTNAPPRKSLAPQRTNAVSPPAGADNR
jgi:hypothetical protein